MPASSRPTPVPAVGRWRAVCRWLFWLLAPAALTAAYLFYFSRVVEWFEARRQPATVIPLLLLTLPLVVEWAFTRSFEAVRIGMGLRVWSGLAGRLALLAV